MSFRRTLSAAVLAGGLTLSAAVVPAAAETTDPAPTSLAEHMDDGNAGVWDRLQSWLETWHDAQHAEPTDPAPEPSEEPSPEPSEEPTEEPTPEPSEEPNEPAEEPTPEPSEEPSPEPSEEAGPALKDATVRATEDNMIVLEGTVTGTTDELTFRASAYEFTGQAGYPAQVTPEADGTVRVEIEDYNNTDPQNWRLELGGSTYTYGELIAEGTITTDEPAPEPTEEPTPEPTEEPAEEPSTGNTTGGSGGPLTDQIDQAFTSNGMTSNYHVFADGLDWSQPVGILMYGDGSGGNGFDNPGSSYLIGGSDGLAAVAAKHNLLLVVPEAPSPGCPSDNCWYDGANAEGKAQWSSDLMDKIKGEYDIDLDRVVTGGYSSGAQWHRWFLPNHAEAQSVDLSVMIAYGGAPAVSADFSPEYKDDLILSWDTGTSDTAYSSASYGAIGGYEWYTDAGFETDYLWPAGVGHGRSGEFGDIMDREITQHLK